MKEVSLDLILFPSAFKGKKLVSQGITVCSVRLYNANSDKNSFVVMFGAPTERLLTFDKFRPLEVFTIFHKDIEKKQK